MKLSHRLEKLEAEAMSRIPDGPDIRDKIWDELVARATRLQDAPTEEILPKCAVIDVAALLLLMRLDEPVLQKAQEIAERDDVGGKLIQGALDFVRERQAEGYGHSWVRTDPQ